MKLLMKRKRVRTGYSLVEAVVGIFVLAIAIGSVFTLVMNTTRGIAVNHQLTVSSSLAEYRMETLRNLPYDEIIDGADDSTLNSLGNDDPDGRYSRSWVVQDDTPVPGLKTVTVTVSWSQFGETRTWDLMGVIADDN